MNRFGTIAAAALALAGCARTDEPAIERPWVRLAAVPGRPAAVYFTLRGGKADATLTRADVAGVTRAELHESRMTAGGQGMTMDSIADVPVPAGGRVVFAPMGKHVMLFGVPASVASGGTARLTLTLGDGRRLAADARVLAASDPAP